MSALHTEYEGKQVMFYFDEGSQGLPLESEFEELEVLTTRFCDEWLILHQYVEAICQEASRELVPKSPTQSEQLRTGEQFSPTPTEVAIADAQAESTLTEEQQQDEFGNEVIDFASMTPADAPADAPANAPAGPPVAETVVTRASLLLSATEDGLVDVTIELMEIANEALTAPVSQLIAAASPATAAQLESAADELARVTEPLRQRKKGGRSNRDPKKANKSTITGMSVRRPLLKQ